VIDAARSDALKADFFQHLHHAMKSKDTSQIRVIKMGGELLKYGKLVVDLLYNSPDMFLRRVRGKWNQEEIASSLSSGSRAMINRK